MTLLQHAGHALRASSIEHLASGNVAGHGRNIYVVYVFMLPRIHIVVRGTDALHGPPWSNGTQNPVKRA